MKKTLGVVGLLAWLSQAFLLPAVPTGSWPNVAQLGFIGLPPFLFVHTLLSLIAILGLFAIAYLKEQ